MYIPTTTLLQANTIGAELSYVEFTANVTITATTEATATTIVTAGALSFDGVARVRIEFFTPVIEPGITANSFINVVLYDGTSIGLFNQAQTDVADGGITGFMAVRYLTPSAGDHTYSIRAYRTVSNGTVFAGAGGIGNFVPGYIRISVA